MAQQLLLKEKEATNNQIMDILFNSDDVTWKGLIFGLIQTEQMDPWNIDISLIANKFLATLKKLKEHDFRVSGKIILASAVLLKLKSDKLMDEEIAALDQMINSVEEGDAEEYFEELVDIETSGVKEKPKLIPRTPQPRVRKVSVYDLVDALEKALQSEVKRPARIRGGTYKQLQRPQNHIDISQIIKETYGRINAYYSDEEAAKNILQFTHLLPSDNKQDKVLTFIPLLHLDNQRKIDVEQAEHFGDIHIHLLEKDATFEGVNFDV